MMNDFDSILCVVLNKIGECRFTRPEVMHMTFVFVCILMLQVPSIFF